MHMLSKGHNSVLNGLTGTRRRFAHLLLVLMVPRKFRWNPSSGCREIAWKRKNSDGQRQNNIPLPILSTGDKNNKWSYKESPDVYLNNNLFSKSLPGKGSKNSDLLQFCCSSAHFALLNSVPLCYYVLLLFVLVLSDQKGWKTTFLCITMHVNCLNKAALTWKILTSP
jgi:hypothetical protein